MGYLIGFVVALIVGSAAFLAYKAHQKGESTTAGRRHLDLAMAQLSREIRRLFLLRNPHSAFYAPRSNALFRAAHWAFLSCGRNLY
jgi:hypothetical protein